MQKLYLKGLLNTQDPSVIRLAERIEITDFDTQKLQAWILEHTEIQLPIHLHLYRGGAESVQPGRTRLIYSLITNTATPVLATLYHGEYTDTSSVLNPKPIKKIRPQQDIESWPHRVRREYEPIDIRTLSGWRDYYRDAVR